MISRLGLIISLLTIILFSCSHQEINSDSTADADSDSLTFENESVVTNIPDGVQLELINVGEAAQSIFQENFYRIEQFHESMIYRKTDKTKELFHSERPDLANAKLTYNAGVNHILYTFYYDPNPADLLYSADSQMMIIDVGTYLFIQNAITDYFFTVKLELQDLGIYLDNDLTITYRFEAPDGSYLNIDLVGHDSIVAVKNVNDPVEYKMHGGFASAPVTVAVRNPILTVEGENSNEAAILTFFGLTYEELVDTGRKNVVEVEEEEYNPPEEIPMELPGDLEVSNSLEYTVEEYGFKINLPASWQNRYAVSESWGEQELNTIDFTFVHDGEVISPIFSILVSQLTPQEFQEYYGGGFTQFIGESNGYTIGYTIPGEPPLELLTDEGKQDLLEELMRMINEDVPEIVEHIEY